MCQNRGKEVISAFADSNPPMNTNHSEADCRQRGLSLWTSPAWRMFWLSVGLVAVQRLLLLVAAVHQSVQRHLPLGLRQLFIGGYAHWDSSWFIQIAQNGYTRELQTAFWPLYPAMMHMLHLFSGISYRATGVAVSLVFFVAALQWFGLAVAEVFDRKTAYLAMTLLAFFPTSYYFVAVYSESLFIALSAAVLYFARVQRFGFASMAVLLAALTRNTGILLVGILAVEVVRSQGNGWRFWTGQWWKVAKWTWLSVLWPILGLSLYLFWLHLRFHHFLAFLTAEHHWKRHFMWPWWSFEQTLHKLFTASLGPWYRQYYSLEAASFLFALVGIVLGWKYIRLSATQVAWWLYLVLVTFVAATDPSARDYLLSFPRFALMLLPAFAFLAAWLRPRWLQGLVLFVFAVTLYHLGGLFYIGRWIA